MSEETLHGEAPKAAKTPKFLFNLDGLGFESTVKGFEKYTPFDEWGLDSHCYASPYVAGKFSQKEPFSTGPLYIRLPLGLYVPKLFKCMIQKTLIKQGHLVMLANVGSKTNVPIMEITLDSISVEEILLGNSTRGKHNKNHVHVENNKHNSFEMFLRFGHIEWTYNSYKQDGSGEGKDAAAFNLMTGEAN